MFKLVNGEQVEMSEEDIAEHEAFLESTAGAALNNFKSAIQALVDSKAIERRYDSGTSLASYVNSTIPEWAAEATAFVEWRDQVWAYAYAELAQVEAGIRPVPTVEEILSELPTLTWPE